MKIVVWSIIPSLTVNKRQNSLKAFGYRLCGCLFVCIDMYYFFDFVLFIFFVFEIIPRMEAFDVNSKSVLIDHFVCRVFDESVKMFCHLNKPLKVIIKVIEKM